MKLVVFGANGSTGRLLTKQALAEGHAVTAVTRHPEAFPLRDARLRVLGGDVFDLSSVGVRRLVCVSSSGVDPTLAWEGSSSGRSCSHSLSVSSGEHCMRI